MANTFTTIASLPKPIDEAQIFQDMENLQSAYTTMADTLDNYLSSTVTVSTGNATVLNTQGKRIVYINAVSAGSISTITGMFQNVPFTIIAQSGASFGISDVGAFALNGALLFTSDDIISLVWDGTRYYELGRSVN